MTEQEALLKRRIKVWRWSGLRVRMTLSYILVTVAAALIAEIVLLSILFVLLTHFALAGDNRLAQAQVAARWYALEVAAQADGTALDPHTTFQGEQPTSIATPPETALAIAPNNSQQFALLIGPNGRVLASTYPARYPPTMPVARLLPKQFPLIKSALVGKSTNPLIALVIPGQIAGTAETVWSRQKRPMGAIYIQVSLDLSSTQLFSPLIWGWGASALLFLAIASPLGVLFGTMTTRGLVRRLQHLALATTRFANGNYEQRLSIRRRDEVGELEEQFNRMAEQLVESIAQRQALDEQNARLSERARIARELHDAISQNLFSLQMLAGGVQTSLPVDSPVAPQIATMRQTTTTILREMRALLLELRPTQLEHLGLTEAIEDLAAAYRARLGITVTTMLTPVPLSMPVEHALLRIAQEALANAARHADATAITLSLFPQDETIQLVITDNGTGFSMATSSKQHGLGLQLMQERVQDLHGTLTIKTAPGQGTCLHLCLPRQ